MNSYLKKKKNPEVLSPLPNLIKTIQPANLISLYPLNERNGIRAYDVNKRIPPGSYLNCALNNTVGPDGVTSAPLFNGASSQANIYQSDLFTYFSPTQASVVVHAKVASSSVWTDATNREILRLLVDGSNWILIRKTTTNNQITGFYNAGAVSKSNAYVTSGPTGWFAIGLTIDKANDICRLWIDGSPVASFTALGTWTGNPTTQSIGAGGGLWWSGWLANVALWNMALTGPDVTLASNRTGFVAFDGDSRSVNTFEAACMADAALASKRLSWDYYAVSGQRASELNNDVSTQITPLFRSRLINNIVVVWAGVNDGVNGATAAQIWSALQTYCTTVRAAGQKVVLCTEIDGQSAALNTAGWHGTIMPTLNTSVRGGWSSVADALADLGANVNLQDATNTTFFNADKVHLTAAGYNIVAGIVAAAIASVTV